MPKVDLSRVPEVMNPTFRFLLNPTCRNNVLVGGAASGKSFDTAEAIVYHSLLNNKYRYLIVRKVGRTLKHSVFDQIMAIILRWGMVKLFTINKTELTITCNYNGNQIIFTGLDDVEKLKSIYGITDIWVEEASEINEADYNQLDLRLRGETDHKKTIILTMNPISAQHWVKKRFFDQVEPDTRTHRSTYKDNTYLDSDTVSRLESIKDEYFKSVYVYGEWGVYGNIVFNNYVIEDFDYKEDDLENVFTGMDYGFIHASTIERGGFRDGELYVFDELYGKSWTNSDFMKAAVEQWGEEELSRFDIVCDSAEPDRIEEWQREGYKVRPAKKGKGSLKYGIDYLNSLKIHIHATKCPKLAEEIQTFHRKEDKNGQAIDDFVEVNDDTIAALRYGTESLWNDPDGYVHIPAPIKGIKGKKTIDEFWDGFEGESPVYSVSF